MITTRMSNDEILSEFKKEKQEIYDHFIKFISANKKLYLKIQKQKGENYKIPCKGIRRTVINYNKYRGSIVVRMISQTKIELSSNIYLVLDDSTTGEKVVYLMPTENKYLLKFTPKFFKEYSKEYKYNSDSFLECVDNYMKRETSYRVEESNTENPKYNCLVYTGNGGVGFGRLDKKSNTIKLKHFNLLEKLYKDAKEGNIEDLTNPLELFLNLRNVKNEETEKNLQQEITEKQKEIELAWKEFENNDKYDFSNY